MAEWQLRFDPMRLHELAADYTYEDDTAVQLAGQQAQEAGYYSFPDFLAVCKWKSPRSQSRCAQNTADDVVEVTRVALSARAERLRIGVLRCLQGVDWPTASVLLHLAHRDPYPILDVRAVWSWGFDEVPAYTFDFWFKYVTACRSLADRHGVDMRTLDRALWQFSKDHQGSVMTS